MLCVPNIISVRAFETRVFLERQYLQPIPQTAIMKNPDLKQNPGW